MIETAEKDVNLDLEQRTSRITLSACIREFEEYMDCYGQLVLIDATSRLRDAVVLAINPNEPDPLDAGDISGLRKSYQALIDFEKKYPFIERNLASKAAKLEKLGDYLTGVKRGN